MSDGSVKLGDNDSIVVRADNQPQGVDLYKAGNELHVSIPVDDTRNIVDLSNLNITGSVEIHIHSSQNLHGSRMIYTPDGVSTDQEVFVHGHPYTLKKEWVRENPEEAPKEVIVKDSSLPAYPVNTTVVAQSGTVTLKDYSPVFWNLGNDSNEELAEAVLKVPTNFAVLYSGNDITINRSNGGVNMYVPMGSFSAENLPKVYQEFKANGIPSGYEEGAAQSEFAARFAAELNGFSERYDAMTDGLVNSGATGLVINGNSEDIAFLYGKDSRINAGNAVLNGTFPDMSTITTSRGSYSTIDGIVGTVTGQGYVFVGSETRAKAQALLAEEERDFAALRSLALSDAESSYIEHDEAERIFVIGKDLPSFDRELEQEKLDNPQAKVSPRNNEQDEAVEVAYSSVDFKEDNIEGLLPKEVIAAAESATRQAQI